MRTSKELDVQVEVASVSARLAVMSGKRGSFVEAIGVKAWHWILPAFLLISFVQIAPMCFAVWLSFYEKSALERHGTFVGFDNYVEQFTTPEFWDHIVTSFIYAFGAVAVQVVLGLTAAILLNMSFRGRGIARTVVLLPYMIPATTAALVFVLALNDLYGVANSFLVWAGILDEPILFLGSQTWAMPTIIAIAGWKWMSFAVIVFLSRLQTIDDSLYESAMVEGAGPVRMFLDITLPSLRAAILLVVLLRSIWMLNKFDIPYLLTYGGPAGATETLPIYAYTINFLQSQQGMGAALAVIMFLLLVVFAVPYFLIFKPEQEVATE